MKQVLVTGGAGYIGSMLVPKLLSYGYKVKVLDLFIYGDYFLDNPSLIKIKGDIRDLNFVKKVLENCDSVIHLACISNDPSFDLDPLLGKSVNFDCFKPLVETSIKMGIKRFIYASSSSVYGIKSEPEVTEISKLEPLTDYSRYKAMCERTLLEYQSPTFCPVILRPATVCGYSVRQRFDLVVNVLVNQAFNNKEIEIFGGNQYRPNIHMEDIIRAYIAVLLAPATLVQGEIFNVGANNLMVSEIAEIIKYAMYPENIRITKIASDDNRSYRINSKKIKNVLEFYPEKTISDAVVELKKKFLEKVFINPLTNSRYFNLLRMQEINLK